MEPQDLSSDLISTLPPSIIDNILCRVHIEEAARTSVLSSEWRYKWTKIPKLVFMYNIFTGSTGDENLVPDSEQTMASERNKMGKRSELFYVIYQVLLMRQGPIREFTLYAIVDKTCVEIDHIISYLSRNNALKKLKLDLFEEQRVYYRLPLSVFSLHRLTDLCLCGCELNFEPTFSGFARLTKLYLQRVYISMKTLLHLLSNSPRLEHFTLIIDKEHIIGDANSMVIELFKCLPVIKHLYTIGSITECFVIDLVPDPTLLIHLKCIYMGWMSFTSADELRFLAFVIRSSPNLENIKLNANSNSATLFDDGMVSVIREAYSDIWMEHLNELEIYRFGNMNYELEFVKFILAKSPKLKKVGLCCKEAIDKNEESKILSILLQSPPASPRVEIVVTSLVGNDRSL